MQSLALQVQGPARQGGALFVRVRGASLPQQARCTWLGHSYAAVALPDEPAVLRVVLPVPVTVTLGAHALDVTVPDTGQHARTRVVIHRTHFSLQSLRLPTAMLASYDSERNRRDDRLLAAAASTFLPQKEWQGDFRAPAAGPQTTAFGERRLYNGWRRSWHHGQDLAVASGTPLRAPAAGVVALVAPGQVLNGNALVLNHGLGITTVYLHLSRIRVRRGDPVRAGQVMGTTGATGAGTGPHLHWECRVHGVAVDPAVLRHLPDGWR